MPDLDVLLPFAFIAVGLVVAVIVILVHRHLEAKRRAALADTATNLGLDFDPEGHSVPLETLAGNHLFSQGHGRRLRNVLHGRRGHTHLLIFDYRFVTGSGKNRSTHRQTVAAFPADASLPPFEVRPENIFHKIGSALGYQDIDFPAFPAFSNKFVVRGPDEAPIRMYFTEQRVQTMMNTGMDCFECGNGWLLLYTALRRLKPAEIPDFIDTAIMVYEAFKPRH